MWGSATRRKERKERKERRKGSRIFLFSKKVFFGKVGLAARMKRRKAFFIVGGDSFIWAARIGVLAGRRRKIVGKEIFFKKTFSTQF